MARRTRMAAMAAAVVLGVGALTACSGDDDPSSSPSADTDPGKPLQTLSADGLPADYPRDEVPLIDGEVTSVQKGSKKDPGYAVAVLTDDAATSAVGEALDLLEGAGWTARTDAAGSPPPVQVLRKGQDQVIITNTPVNGQTMISYAIDLY